jgi:hypothetical protein
MIEKGECPLCHRANACAIVANEDPLTCWCMSTKVPEELLKRIPEAQRGMSCVCKHCVDEYLNSKTSKVDSYDK